MINIDKNLIKKELKRHKKNGFKFHYQNLTDNFIYWLFKNYYIGELCEMYYDSEPEFDEEEYLMYMDYEKDHEVTGLSFWYAIDNYEKMQEEKENFRYSNEFHTKEELKVAYDKVVKMYEDYEETRLKFNNWIEPYFRGNWGSTQKDVNNYGREILKGLQNFPNGIKDRLYIGEKEDDNEYIVIYFYARDTDKLDYWFTFKRRDKDK